jgi:hypothetical protein
MDIGLEERAPPLTFGDPVVEYAESHGATGTSFRSGVRILDTLTATARTPACWWAFRADWVPITGRRCPSRSPICLSTAPVLLRVGSRPRPRL